MKCCIAYASTHHGNTKKVVDAIAKEFDVDVIDVTDVRQSVVTVGDAKQIDGLVKKYFPDPFEHKDSAVIPFSLDRFAELEGDFIDDYKNTEKICRAAVKGGNKYELKNCDNFLNFIKTAGLEQ